jgi:hypothetical protein
MRNNNLLKDGDWMTKKEALRDNLPAQFNDKDIQSKLQEVGMGNGVGTRWLPGTWGKGYVGEGGWSTKKSSNKLVKVIFAICLFKARDI